MSKIKVCATQMACSWDLENNLDNAERLVRKSAAQGGQVILLQELFASPYFCSELNDQHFALAQEFGNSPLIERFTALAGELSVVLPISFFERDGDAYFNSLCVADADGKILGNYRKSHIPSGPGYQEDYYFRPGDTGFMVWDTRYACLGVGICWDQWFPEAARAMAMQGAELLLYPTAIGSEPEEPELDSSGHWQRVMQGHAGANLVPVIASNRIGSETNGGVELTFYGSSFICDHRGAMLQAATCDQEQILMQEIDLTATAKARKHWGVFQSRRPDLYHDLTYTETPN
jgi:N-carbamoylputrescine amidase